MARVRFKSPALSFDGVDDYVEMAHHAAYNVTNLTIEAWAKPNLQSDNGAIFEKSVGEVVDTQYSLFQQGAFWIFRGGTVDISTPIGAGDVGVQVHLAGTFDGTNKRLYKNGVLISGPTASGALATGTGKSRIGALFPSAPPGFQYPFDGLIDEVRIWNVARTQAQIQDNIYRRLVGTESGLVGYWKMDENAGGQAKDSTANANHGTITGAAWSTRDVVASLSSKLEVDWDGDGTFDDATADIRTLILRRGRDPAFGSVVAGSLDATLNNPSDKYSHDKLSPISSNLRPYRNFKFTLLAGQTSFQRVSGKLLRVDHAEPQDDIPSVRVEGRDLFLEMDAEARVDTLQNTTTKVLAETVLDAVGVTSARRVIGVAGDPIAFAFGERRSARSWLDAISLFGYRQFVDSDGRYNLLDRLTAIAWEGDEIGAVRKLSVATDDEGLTTRARVLVHPHKAHTTDHIIWTSGETPFALLAGEERTLLISFRDPDKGVATGAISLVTPAATAARTGTLTSGSAIVTGLSHTSDLRKGQGVSGTGVPAGTTIKTIDTDTQIALSANATATGSQSLTFSPMDFKATNPDGSGDRTSDLQVTLIGNPSVSAQLKVKNTALSNISVSVLQVRGKLAAPQDVQAIEQELTTDYPDLYRELDADLIQDTSTAQTVLSYLLNRFSKPPRRYRASWSDVDVWSSVVVEADINDVVLLNPGGDRMERAYCSLRGMEIQILPPNNAMEASIDHDFIALASGPSQGVLNRSWDRTL